MVVTSKAAWNMPTLDDIPVKLPGSFGWRRSYRPDGTRHVYIPIEFRRELIADPYYISWYNRHKALFGLNPLPVDDFERYCNNFNEGNEDVKLELSARRAGHNLLSLCPEDPNFHRKRKKMMRLIERITGARARYEYTREGYDLFSFNEEIYPFKNEPAERAFLGLVLGLSDIVHRAGMEGEIKPLNDRRYVELTGSIEKPVIKPIKM